MRSPGVRDVGDWWAADGGFGGQSLGVGVMVIRSGVMQPAGGGSEIGGWKMEH